MLRGGGVEQSGNRGEAMVLCEGNRRVSVVITAVIEGYKSVIEGYKRVIKYRIIPCENGCYFSQSLV